MTTTCLERKLQHEAEKGKVCKYCLLKGTFGDSKTNNEYAVKEFVGSGYAGTVYRVQNTTTHSFFVAKFLALETNDELPETSCVNTTFEAFEKEWQQAADLGSKGLAPRVIYVDRVVSFLDGLSVELGVIVSDQWDISLNDYMNLFPTQFKENEKDIDQQLASLGEKYAENNIYHADVHKRNIVLKLDPKTKKVVALTFIDFNGFSFNSKLRQLKKRKPDATAHDLINEMISGAKEEPAV